MQTSGASRRGNAKVCLERPSLRWRNTHPCHRQAKTGRPSIPETPAIEPKSRGVMDRPVKPGDDKF